MVHTRKTRVALLCAALCAAVLMSSTTGRTRAQGSSQEDAVVKLAGKKLRVDKATGRLRPISAQEAREMVATLTTMTARTEVGTATASSGGELAQMAGFDHVVIGRPNEDGTTDARCVSSVDEAVAFLGQSASSGQE